MTSPITLATDGTHTDVSSQGPARLVTLAGTLAPFETYNIFGAATASSAFVSLGFVRAGMPAETLVVRGQFAKMYAALAAGSATDNTATVQVIDNTVGTPNSPNQTQLLPNTATDTSALGPERMVVLTGSDVYTSWQISGNGADLGVVSSVSPILRFKGNYATMKTVPSGNSYNAGTVALYVVDNTVQTASPVVVSPSSVTMDDNGSQLFTASGGTPPYTWSALLGDFVVNDYFPPAGPANDTVTATDKQGRTGTAPVTVRAPVIVAGTPAPFSGQYVFNPAQAGQGPNYALTVTGGLAPYTWSFRQNASGASLSSSTGPAITYTAGTGTGIDIVQAVDSAGESTIWEGSAQIGGVHVNPP